MAITPAEILAAEIADLKRRISDMERTAQLTRSTIVDEHGHEMTVLDGLRAGWNAQTSAATAISAATEARAKADGAVVTYFGPNEPPLTGDTAAKPGDLWRQTGGEVYQVNAAGNDWVQVSANSDLTDALDSLAGLESAIDGKITTYYFPSGTPPYEPEDGDLWIVPDLDNQVRRYDSDQNQWIPLLVGSDAIENFAITAAKLEATLVLASRVIAGSPTGKRAEMNSDGFHVYVPDGDGVREVARLGVADENDSLTVARSDGEAVATISEDGVMSGAQMNSDSVFYRGDELDLILDQRPRGIIARGMRDTHATYITSGTERPYLRVDAVLHPGRQYRIWTSPLVVVNSNGTTTLGVHLSYKIGEQCTTSNAVRINACRCPGDWTQVMFNEPFQLPSTYTEPQTVSFLISAIGSGGNGGGIYCETGRPGHLVVEDVGHAVEDTGIKTLNASTDRAALVDRQVLTLNHSTLTVYHDGDKASNTGTQWSPGYVGQYAADLPEYATFVTFPDVTSALSGRTVLSARVQVPVRSWIHPSGIDSLALSTHGTSDLSTPPATLPTLNSIATTYGMPAPSTRWIELPSSVFSSLKTGAVRGVIIHRPTVRNTEYWGVLGTSQGDPTRNIAPTNITLEITYQ